jgi:hypothetical protein
LRCFGTSCRGSSPHRSEYLRQLEAVQVVDESGCCPSIRLRVPPLTVDRAPVASSPVEHPLPVEGRWQPLDTAAPLDLIVFQRDGWLSYLEIVHYEETGPESLPPLEEVELIVIDRGG